MEKRTSRLRKGQASLERPCHISSIAIPLSIPPPATAMEGNSRKLTGRVKLTRTSEESWPHPYKVSHLKEIKTNQASIFHVQEQCPSFAHPILFMLV